MIKLKTFNFVLDNGDKNHGTVYLPEDTIGKLPVMWPINVPMKSCGG